MMRLAELAVAVGLWQQILDTGQLVEDSPDERRFRSIIESAAEELRESGFDPAAVLDRAGVQLTGAHAMRVTMGSAVAELREVADPAGSEGSASEATSTS